MHVKWTVGRIFLSLVTVIFLGAGACGLWAGWQWQQDLESWRTFKVMEGPVDISASGEFEFRYLQNSQIPHDAQIWLRLPDEFLAQNDPETLLSSLRASVSVTGEDGVNLEFGPDWMADINRAGRKDGMFYLLPLPIVGKGTGQVKLVIHQGVPGLRGLPQHIEGRYQLCGCEGIPIYIFNGFGGACAVIGSLLALAFYRCSRKDQSQAKINHV
jgi:hypothetical protein